MIIQRSFGIGLVPSGNITWANVDPDQWRHMESLGHKFWTHQCYPQQKYPKAMILLGAHPVSAQIFKCYEYKLDCYLNPNAKNFCQTKYIKYHMQNFDAFNVQLSVCFRRTILVFFSYFTLQRRTIGSLTFFQVVSIQFPRGMCILVVHP